MEGMLNVKSSKVKQDLRKSDERKIVKDYLKNFNKAHALFGQESSAGEGLTNHLQFNLQKNIVKDMLKKGVHTRMKAA